MATYIKGHKNFYPDIKPFTPDYKFLSAAIDGRQAIYDSNFKQQNDLYNRVVYSDLTNPNSIEYQRQYSEKLAPQLEKIAGMDLSLEQNLQSAKSVFAPFFEDDTVVYDMVWTNQLKDSIKKYNQIAGSGDPNVRSGVNEEVSLQKLQIDRQKFMEADRDQILNQRLPELVMDADLIRNAKDYLKELDPNLSITMPVPNIVNSGKVDKQGNPILVQDNKFLLTQTNGSLVEGPAYEAIMSALYNDPRVTKYYDAKSYVQANNFARQAMDSGAVQTEEEGLQLWSAETLSRLDKLNNDLEVKAQSEARRANQININWNNFASTNGIVPGSVDEQIMLNSKSEAQQMQIAYARFLNQRSFSQTPDIDPIASYNKASTLLSNYNMDQDMRTAARQYSQQGMKIEKDINQYALNEEKERLRRKTDRIKHRQRLDQIKYKSDLDALTQGNLIQDALNTADTSNVVNNVLVDEKGDIVDSNAIDTDLMAQKNDRFVLDNDFLNELPDFLSNMGENGPYGIEGSPGMYKIPNKPGADLDNDADYTPGNQTAFMEFLASKQKNEDEEETNQFANGDIIDDIFGNVKGYYKDTHTAYLNNPNDINDAFLQNYDQLFKVRPAGTLSGLAIRDNLYDLFVEDSIKDLEVKYNTVDESINIINEKEGGNPKNPSGKDGKLYNAQELKLANYPAVERGETNDDYYERVLGLVKNGTIGLGRVDQYGLLNNNNLIEGAPAVESALAAFKTSMNLINPFRSDDAVEILKEGTKQYLGQKTDTGIRIDVDALRKRTDNMVSYYKNQANQLMDNTNTRSYVNNRSGITNQGYNNMSTRPVTSVVTNYRTKGINAETVVTSDAIKQIKNGPNLGDSGFLGTTASQLETDDFFDLVGSDGLPFNGPESKAAEFIYNSIITELKRDPKSKLANEISFFPTWGVDIYDDEKPSLAAYEFNDFDKDTKKFINALIDNDMIPSNTTGTYIREALKDGFTYVFPRDKTLVSNKLSYKNTLGTSFINSMVKATPNNFYELPPQFPSAFVDTDGNSIGNGKAQFSINENNRMFVNLEVYQYESDALKYPLGYSTKVLQSNLEIKSDFDAAYQNIYDRLRNQKIMNTLAKQKASKTN